MFKWIAKCYIKRCMRKAVRECCTADMCEIMALMFTEARANDSESNDSTIYAWMLRKFNQASKVLPHVSDALREK